MLESGGDAEACAGKRAVGYPTPAFASPEAARSEPRGLGSDVFAAASLCHWLLVGAPPVPDRAGSSLRAAIASQPPTLRPVHEALVEVMGDAGAALMLRCWASHAMDRPTAAAVLVQLKAITPPAVAAAGLASLAAFASAFAPRLGALPVQAAEDRDELVTGDDDVDASRAQPG